ncbi:hypothetical protein [Sulfitobacter sp. 1A13679]|uniref:hypothetical protein n=1 Tax=Sulfitobacter sp. 1A13679 TaxID=3368597 RepID=UPI003746BA48
MPYVEVWIDEEPCDGTCEGATDAKRLQAKVDEAERHLRAGDPEAALAALTGEPSVLKSPDWIAERYKTWQAGKLPGFTNYTASH